MGGFMVGMAYTAAFALLWHCTQLDPTEGAFAWIAAMVGITEKSPLAWHAVQVALAEVGMWFAGFFRLAVSKEKPL